MTGVPSRPAYRSDRGRDPRLFLRAWAAAPLEVAAIAPSGPSLARLMTASLGPGTGPILELGPGTGSFTEALLRRGVDPADLTLVEINPRFAAHLGLRFPDLCIVTGDASRISPDCLYPVERAGAAISGLGLLSMPPGIVLRILSGTFACLRPDGFLHQFTYGPRCPVPPSILERLGLEAERIGFTWRNLPPASVYRIARQPASPRHLRSIPARTDPREIPT